MAKRIALDNNEIENVNGGVFKWDGENSTMTYVREDGTTTTHTVLDFNNAWYYSNLWHAENIPEDEILEKLQKKTLIT